MNTEMRYLLATILLTALLRVPWLINKVTVRGLGKVTGYPNESEPLAPWARRLWYAHEDALDNLILFASLVFLVQIADASSTLTRGATALYFWARLTHAIVYALAVPWLKTIAYLVAFASLLVLASSLIVVAVTA